MDNCEAYDHMMEKHGEYLGCLRDRWQDEKKYEDFKDYRKAICERLDSEEQGLKVLKVTSTPFRVLVYNAPGNANILIKVNAQSLNGMIQNLPVPTLVK